MDRSEIDQRQLRERTREREKDRERKCAYMQNCHREREIHKTCVYVCLVRRSCIEIWSERARDRAVV
ncbi:hypothetical protein CSUI_002262 [Cystoisospora suis]|uniref:Uncharacterized protein n=1 Tax=Cystoisospora suis TaxID=483139 RepID=A0A2C6L5D9_9APIC|nr:hypothetical protein CSUI_002262 [Cystoisospora suis]